eukprot:1146781-Pelagomonas_calceolata.AAC.11
MQDKCWHLANCCSDDDPAAMCPKLHNIDDIVATLDQLASIHTQGRQPRTYDSVLKCSNCAGNLRHVRTTSHAYTHDYSKAHSHPVKQTHTRAHALPPENAAVAAQHCRAVLNCSRGECRAQ